MRVLILLLVLAAGPAAAQTQPAYVLIRQDKNSATLLDFKTARHEGDVVGMTSMTLLAEPDKDRGVDFYWLDSLEEFDCGEHVWRSAVDSRRTLDRARRQRISDPDASEDWTEVDASTSDMEALFCKGKVADRFKAVDDLAAFEKSYLKQP